MLFRSRGEADPYPGYTPTETVLTVTWSKNYTTPPVLTFTYELATTAAEKADLAAAAQKVDGEDNALVTPTAATERAAKTAIVNYLKTISFTDSEGHSVAISTLDGVECEIVDFTAPTAINYGRATVNVTLKKGNAVETIKGLTFRLAAVMAESGAEIGDDVERDTTEIGRAHV